MRLAKARVHFIGVGGIGMCGLAELLHNMGAQVTGSDASENTQTTRLKQIGIKVYKGHAEENLGDCEVVVYSSAVRDNNVEYQAARRNKIPLIRRAEALADMMSLKRGIAIAGTHGKTTTTSLTASVFLKAKLDPTIIVGGRLDVIKSTAQLGKGDWLIAEADESDGSFTHLSPEIVVITNIDNDHLDHYKTFENLQSAFFDFAARIPFYGVAIVCGDDVNLRRIFNRFGKRWISYGVGKDNDFVLGKQGDHWEVKSEGRKLGELHPAMPGQHNALNGLAAILVGMQAGVSFETAAAAIHEFGGVDRRFQHKGQARGVDFYDDYGHHPTEVKAVLSGFKEKFPERRLVTVFQPHRYSRTQICWDDFKSCFQNTDTLFLLDIYPAGEAPLEGVSSAQLAQEIDHSDCRYLNRQQDPQLSTVAAFLKPGDILVTLGAGDISKLGEQFTDSYSKGG
ncbi:MAG: UDP-N-acetylmuramate--L-alanine ligase [Bdellovibrionales bacterium]|nr:UDP-N-acetylmuramate--L-alanine ligase [Bdellovibrionales bacterium]